MTEEQRQPEDLLLDLHLGRLSEDEKLWIETELLRSAELRAKSDCLGRMLQPLDTWTIPPMPSGLPDKILDYVEANKNRDYGASANRPPLRAVGAVAPTQPNEGNYRRGWIFSLRELLAAAACIVLLFGVMMPSLSRARDSSRRNVCGSNLTNIFQGLSTYQQMSDGALPYAGNTPGARWLPTGADDRPQSSNSRHPYLLLRVRAIHDPNVFTCPADDDMTAMSAEEITAHRDFPSANNMSFDTLNMNSDQPPVSPSLAIPYMSDRNPLFEGGAFNAELDPDNTNSFTHGAGKGQNVLMLDGQVYWLTSPLWGPKLDNIWLAGSIRKYEGTESQKNPNDAFLVPGFPIHDSTDKQTDLSQ